jgi:hypothetical protein
MHVSSPIPKQTKLISIKSSKLITFQTVCSQALQTSSADSTIRFKLHSVQPLKNLELFET